MNTAILTIKNNETLENIAKSAIMTDREKLECKAIDLILKLPDEKIQEIMESFNEKNY